MPAAEHPKSADVRVAEYDGTDEAWDAFVARAPNSRFAHLAGWRAIMSDVLGHECIYLAARDRDGELRGVLPLVRVRGLLGHHLISMPFLNDGGPLGEPAVQEVLVAWAAADAARSGASLLELRSRSEVPGPVKPQNRKVTVHLPLPSSLELLWEKTFRAKLRSPIRRPSKEGMVARCGASELSAFYEVFTRNMRDLGTPVLPRAFFERLADIFGARVLFTSVASRDGKAAAAACTLIWREEAEIVWASSLRQYNQLSPNMLLYARTMEESIACGARLFNFGRCTPGSPTHKFKLQWGGYDVPLSWPAWMRNGNGGIPSGDSAKFRLATAVWRHLPLAVANRFGPFLSRQLP